MEDKDIEFFRHLLTQWMKELLDHADDTVEGLLDSRENLADHWIELLLNRAGLGHCEFGTEKAC